MNLGIENEWTEFKKTTGELKEGIISVSSMLNKNGYASLYFGVKNNGDIVGQQIGDRTLRDISQAITDNIKPQMIPTITLELIDGKNVIKVYAEGSDRPYSAFGRYYIRSADEDRELSPEQLREMLLRKASLDPIVRMVSPNRSLSFGQLKTMFAAKGFTVNDESFESNAGLRAESGRYNLMAEILADENDVSIKVASFAGKDKRHLIKRNEYGYKSLVIAMEQVISYIDSIDETKVEVGRQQRQEKRLFDMNCFREAWVNACLHTKWELMNSPAVYVFSDRIEVISTGGLPQDLSEDEFFMGISRPVNIKLQKILGQLGFVEQTGHGVPLIVSHYGRQAFSITDNHIMVTIPFSNKLRTDSIMMQPEEPELNRSQQLILSILRQHPGYTIRDMEAESGLSNGYVRKILQYLKTNNYIRRMGSKKTGKWTVM